MRPSNLKKTIKALYAVKRTVCIEGPPGGGKTSIVREVADELGIEYTEKHMPTMLVEDFGIPMPQDGVLKYTIPEWFPREPDSKGILCFDDRNQANADLQKVLANICQARELHGHKLPAGWMVISTGNRQEDRAGANRVLSHLRNRETVLAMETEYDDWSNWALQNGVPMELVAFLKFRSELLHKFDPQAEINPTPRSWTEGVGQLIGVVPQELEAECFSGSVGAGPTAEFGAYLQIYRTLPDPDLVLKNPTTADIPTKNNVLYALCAALASRANAKTADNFFTYIARMQGEFMILAANMAVRGPNKAELVSSPAFAKFARDPNVKNMLI